MKKIVILLACVMMFLVACSDTSQKNENKAESYTPDNSIVSETEDSSAESASIAAETNMENTNMGNLVEVSFGYTEDIEYKKYFTLKMPVDTQFVGGTFNRGTEIVSGGMSCGEYVSEMADSKMEIGSFVDNDFFGGSVNVMAFPLTESYDSYAEKWSDSGDSTVIGSTDKKSSGEKDGYKWNELYGIDANGTYTYHLLIEMDSKVVYSIDLFGSNGKYVYNQETAHDYFLGAITRVN